MIEREIGVELFHRDAEALGDLLLGRIAVRGEPRDHREDAFELGRGVGPTHVSSALGVPDQASSAAITASRAAGGSTICTWSRKPSTKLTTALDLDGADRDARRAVGHRLDLRVGTDGLAERDLVARIHLHHDVGGAPLAVVPRAVLEVGVGAEVGGHVEAAVRTGLDVVLDPVGAIHPHVVGAAVEPDHVPVPELRRQPPRLELAEPTTVREVHDGAPTRRLEQRREHVDEGQLGNRCGAGALDPAELHQRALPRRAAQADRGDRDVEGRELVVGQTEVREVVLRRRDAVPGLGVVADVPDGHPHRAERGLVALEGPAGGCRVRRVAECRVRHDVVAGEAGTGLDERGEQVEEPLAPVGTVAASGRRLVVVGHQVVEVTGAAAHTPAAAAHWKRIGSSAAGRPIELTRRSWDGERLEHVGDVDGHDVVARRDAGGGRAPRAGRPRPPLPSAGTGTVTRLRVPTVKVVPVWCEMP